MSDETEFNPIQFSIMIGDRQLVFRGRTGKEMLDAVESMAETNEEFLQKVNELQQTHLAQGIFSRQKEPQQTQQKSKAGTKTDTPPPAPTSNSGEEPPECLHGPMNDLSGYGYKRKWYCPEFGKDKKCWAKD